MKKKQIVKKACSIAVNILLYLFIAICVVGVVSTIVGKRDVDGAITVFGKQMRVVLSPSMEKCEATDVSDFDIKDIPTGSMIFIDVVPEDAAKAEEWYADLRVGDVLTFRYVYVTQETITHRITHIEKKASGGYIIELAGDNKDADSENLTQYIDTSEENSLNYVIGKVTGQSYVLGLVTRTISSPVGLVFVVIVPCLLIVIFEVLRIVNYCLADKRKKEKQAQDKQQAELDELRRRLAELEKGKGADAPEDGNNGNMP